MPRKLLKRSDRLPYHVTARANNRECFPLAMDKLWKIVEDECLFLSIVYEVEFHALVLMPNHFHIILTVPTHDLGVIMNEFMKSVSRRTNLESGRSGHLFGGPYHWSLINNSRYFGHALKYVYRNPVRAKICESVENYPYSTLFGLLGKAHLTFPLRFTRVGMEIALPSTEGELQLDWLNTPFPTESERLIQLGLRRRLFDSIIDRKTRRAFEPLNQLI
jgi:REP element-mobilizing transposase RayT